MISHIFGALTAFTAMVPTSQCSPASADQCITVSPASMFRVAEEAQRNADPAAAEAIYHALSSNPSIEIRSEARFRLALLLISGRRLAAGASILRTLLDEQPGASRVRLELAAVLAKMGDESAARRELRAAQAGDLPPEVAQMVDRFSAALRARKPMGGSVAIAIASDSNINRATQSDTLGTIIGDFVLDDQAKARSGRGLAVDGQGYGRFAVGGDRTFLFSLSGSADLYGENQFSDLFVVARAGPELKLGGGRLNLSGGTGRRWFGGQAYTTSVGGAVDFTHPILRVAQARGSGTVDRIRNHRNALETGWAFSGSTALEVALSPRSGAGIALNGIRRSLRDPGYSTTAGQITAFGYREIGRMTVATSATVGRLEADERLLLFPGKRSETLLRGKVGATFRQLTFRGFAPTAQFTFERNRSNIEIYDFRRKAFEIGVVRAF